MRENVKRQTLVLAVVLFLFFVIKSVYGWPQYVIPVVCFNVDAAGILPSITPIYSVLHKRGVLLAYLKAFVEGVIFDRKRVW